MSINSINTQINNININQNITPHNINKINNAIRYINQNSNSKIYLIRNINLHKKDLYIKIEVLNLDGK